METPPVLIEAMTPPSGEGVKESVYPPEQALRRLQIIIAKAILNRFIFIVLSNDQLNRLALERQRKRQSELKLLLGQQISDNVNS